MAPDLLMSTYFCSVYSCTFLSVRSLFGPKVRTRRACQRVSRAAAFVERGLLGADLGGLGEAGRCSSRLYYSRGELFSVFQTLGGG